MPRSQARRASVNFTPNAVVPADDDSMSKAGRRKRRTATWSSRSQRPPDACEDEKGGLGDDLRDADDQPGPETLKTAMGRRASSTSIRRQTFSLARIAADAIQSARLGKLEASPDKDARSGFSKARMLWEKAKAVRAGAREVLQKRKMMVLRMQRTVYEVIEKEREAKALKKLSDQLVSGFVMGDDDDGLDIPVDVKQGFKTIFNRLTELQFNNKADVAALVVECARGQGTSEAYVRLKDVLLDQIMELEALQASLGSRDTGRLQSAVDEILQDVTRVRESLAEASAKAVQRRAPEPAAPQSSEPDIASSSESSFSDEESVQASAAQELSDLPELDLLEDLPALPLVPQEVQTSAAELLQSAQPEPATEDEKPLESCDEELDELLVNVRSGQDFEQSPSSAAPPRPASGKQQAKSEPAQEPPGDALPLVSSRANTAADTPTPRPAAPSIPPWLRPDSCAAQSRPWKPRQYQATPKPRSPKQSEVERNITLAAVQAFPAIRPVRGQKLPEAESSRRQKLPEAESSRSCPSKEPISRPSTPAWFITNQAMPTPRCRANSDVPHSSVSHATPVSSASAPVHRRPMLKAPKDAWNSSGFAGSASAPMGPCRGGGSRALELAASEARRLHLLQA